jgi:hypothetical protein
MARAGYSRRAILRETGFSAAQIEEILVRVGRKAKR